MLSRPNRFAQRRFRHFAVALAPFFLLLFATGAAAAPAAGKGGGKPGKGTSSPPTISIAAPSSGSTVSGSVTVSGSASDSSASLASVKVSVDGGAFKQASGTTSWGFPLNTASYANGTHTIAAQATDSLGNAVVTTAAVMFSNSPSSPPPPPPPPPDTSPPSVAISAPAPSTTVSGTVSVSGSASDNVGVSAVQVSVDGGAYQTAQGTSNWSYSLDTTTLSNGTHTLAARATDTSGNASTTSESVTVQNSTSLPPGVIDQMVTPEGATIQIYSGVTGWTAQQIYDLLKPNAYQLSLIGPHYTIKVQTQYTSSTTTSVSGDATTGYSNYQAVTYLDAAAGTNFSLIPDAILAHEYGFAWAFYHLYMTERGSWDAYLQARGILGDSRLDTSLMWNRGEILAEDYRLLFGTSTAQSGMAQMNYQIPDARQVAGLKDFLASSW